MTDIVIYYSRTGKTKLVAETIAEQKNADKIEIKDIRSRSGIHGFIKGAIETIATVKTDIIPKRVDLKEYDTVYIGTPVWASRPTPAINQIIANCNFEDKNVITFATLNGSGAENTIKILNDAITDKGGNVINSFAIITKNTDIEKLTRKALNDMEW